MAGGAIGLFAWYEQQTSYEQYGMKQEGKRYQVQRKERDDAFRVFKRADASITPVLLSNPISVDWKVGEQTKDGQSVILYGSLAGYQLREDSIEEMHRYLSSFLFPYPSNEKEVKRLMQQEVLPWINTYYKTLISSHTYEELPVEVNNAKEEKSPPVSFHVKWNVRMDVIKRNKVLQE